MRKFKSKFIKLTEKLNYCRNYYLIIDVETANTLDDPLVYDIGGAIIDKKGKVYDSFSFLIYDIFIEERELMQTAYYAEKIPLYEQMYREKKIKMVRWLTAKNHIQELCDIYRVKAIIAHNAVFDYKAVQTTQRYLTSSKYRWFLPYGIPMWCTMRMAESVIATQKSYRSWCVDNGYVTQNGRPRLTAEILHRYISGNNDFIEEHTGLADVLIEKDIFVQCVRQKKKMRRSPWANKELSLEEKLERGWEVG